jgi:DNA mismatch endonuclease (patch repair protein)
MALSRSEQMARIRGTGTAPEVALANALAQLGVVARSGLRVLGARPDLVLEASHTAIFIDGCFWHGCPIHYTRPGTRPEFWAHKLRSTVERDRRQTLALEAAGWKVARFWEHDLATALPTIATGIAAGGTKGVSDDGWRVLAVTVLDEEARIERRQLVDLRDDTVRCASEGRRDTSKWARSSRTEMPSPSRLVIKEQ